MTVYVLKDKYGKSKKVRLVELKKKDVNLAAGLVRDPVTQAQ